MQIITLIVANLFIFMASTVPYASSHFSTSSTDKFIYDDDGRVSIFHGANMVIKFSPWYPAELLNEAHVAEMASWGFNSVRLGVMWTGFTPQEPGIYNETYIQTIGSILATLEKYGIAAIIDVHQDVLSSYFCEYDGAPTWLVDLSNSSEHAFPYPLEGDCSTRGWAQNYFAEATGAAFQDIYDNSNGMRDHFVNFWKTVASSYKSMQILGYEIINEPWAGNIYKDPSLLLPGVAGRENLQPFYDVVAAAIREEDPDHIVLYEPVTWGMILNGTLLGSGFAHVPGGVEYAHKSIYSFHYYCWWFGNGGVANRATCDKLFGPKVFSQVDSDISRLGGAAMLTEWGQGCDPPNGLVEECDAIMNLSDEHFTSWTSWYFFPEHSVWYVPTESIDVFSRTFAQRIAGKPSKMTFNSKTFEFELCYTVDISISKPTEIYANFQMKYVNGVEVKVSGDIAGSMQVFVDEEANKVFVSYVGTNQTPEITSTDICIYIANKA
jgi:endoglycosylceramidase